ncbi:sigma-70 family RNA polymerase sigma factor [Radiobacillus sp. PE A8.2]|uniref:sigma-70 family RNA polymerase sigma factor n=1 Tax=Radiobacillus sp. PE A8.2 TaxID=3380349 RepID=UPI00388FEDDA
MNDVNDNDILFQKDKDEWFEAIMDEFGERLTKLAYNYLKDWRLAEDVVQDVFITCYKYENISEITSFKSWIYRITINKAKDVLKSAAFRKVVMNSNLFHRLHSNDLSPEMHLIKRSDEEFLSLCVLSLPLRYREVVTLYYYEQLSIDTISEITNINNNTIKTRLNRGRKKLKSMLEREL